MQISKKIFSGFFVFTILLFSSVSFANGSNLPIDNKTLTEDERELLNHGEITDAQYIAGGVVGTFVGMGIGNAIQGTYMPKGLIFTLGEVAGASVIVAGALDCVTGAVNSLTTSGTVSCTNSTITTGLAIVLVFRVWEIIDVWTTPPSINRQIRNIRERTGLNSPSAGLAPVLSPTGALSGAQLSLKFNF